MRRVRGLGSILVLVRNQHLSLTKPPNYTLLSFSTHTPWKPPNGRVDDDATGSDDDDDDESREKPTAVDCEQGNALVRMLLAEGQPVPEMKRRLQEWEGAAPLSPELVSDVLSRVRNHWEAAYAFFLWAAEQQNYSHSLREYHSMLSILGKMRQFDPAWSLIRDRMLPASLVTPHTLLIMIRRYSAARDVGSAVGTFRAHAKFGLRAGAAEFHGLLAALCRHNHLKDAERLLFSAGSFDTKSFNILLHGWARSPREANRIWWEMARRSVPRDAVSYSALLACHSRSGNLYKVLRVFERMKRLGIAPDRRVYNAVAFALARGGLPREAARLVGAMEESGVPPNAATYNSLIKPLCKARRVEEARGLYREMVRRRIAPSLQTYHAFFRALRTDAEVFALLGEMSCRPDGNTLVMLIRKFCRWRQLDNVFRLWRGMGERGLSPDRSSYIVLVHGLFLNGELELANKYYSEMKERQYLPEPKTEEMLRAWLSGRTKQQQSAVPPPQKPEQRNRSLRAQPPEARKVVRDRGFSFWDQ